MRAEGGGQRAEWHSDFQGGQEVDDGQACVVTWVQIGGCGDGADGFSGLIQSLVSHHVNAGPDVEREEGVAAVAGDVAAGLTG